MFGVDFSELLVIMLVALVVIGPERLPKVARTLGLLWGRAQRYINGVKADISRDMAFDELRQLQQKVQQEVGGAEQSMRQVERELELQVQQLNSTVAQPAQDMVQQTAAIPNSAADNSRQSKLELQLSPEQKKFPVD